MIKRGINKKGISPFIAAVILIIVAVAIGVIVANFIRGYVGGTLSEVRTHGARGMSCSLSVNFEIQEINGVKQITNDGHNITATIHNIGTTTIENFSIIVINEEGEIAQEYMTGQQLLPAGMRRFTFDHGLGEDLSGVTITPVIIQDAQLSECVNIKFSTNQFASSVTISSQEPCVLDGISLMHGEDRIFYNSKCVPFGSSCEGESISCNDGELQGNLEYQYSKCYSCNVGYDCVEKCILKNIDFESDSPGQCPQNWDCTGSSRISSPSNRNCAAPGNLQGQHYFEVGCDHTIGTATSYNFYLPEDIHKITFLRAGGSDSGSGFYLKRASNDEILCSAETGTNTDTFFVDFCEDLEEHAETEVYIFLRDIQTGGWSKVYIDDIRFITNS